MNAYQPDYPAAAGVERLEKLLLASQTPDFIGLRLRLIDGEVILEGSVTSYEAKCRIEQLARAAGFEVQNWLRVIPGEPPAHVVLQPLIPIVDAPPRSAPLSA